MQAVLHCLLFTVKVNESLTEELHSVLRVEI